MKRILIALVCFVALSSHELFLKTDSYFFQTNADGELALFDGTFDFSESSTDVSGMYNTKIMGPDYSFEPTQSDFYDKENTTFLKFKSGGDGTYVAGIAIKPNIIELDATEFNDYLLREELIDMMNARERKGTADQGAREKYSKYVKTIFQVGEGQSDHYNQVMGYPVEFVPQSNPYTHTVGETMTLKLLKEGEPISKQLVHYSWRGPDGSKPLSERTLRTDENGSFEVLVDQAGHWYFYTTYMIESDEADIDYISKWATITFAVK